MLQTPRRMMAMMMYAEKACGICAGSREAWAV